jgi:quinol monooxygenase YgiN
MSVFVTAEIFIKPELVNDAVKLLGEVLPETRRFAGCETVETVIDLDEPAHIMLVERWASRDAHVAYLGWRQESGSLALLFDMIAAPPVFRYFEPRPDI